MLGFVLIQFSYLSISLEEFDDFSDSDSDYEATIKATKRKKQTVPGPQVKYFILSQNSSLSYYSFILFTRE